MVIDSMYMARLLKSGLATKWNYATSPQDMERLVTGQDFQGKPTPAELLSAGAGL